MSNRHVLASSHRLAARTRYRTTVHSVGGPRPGLMPSPYNYAPLVLRRPGEPSVLPMRGSINKHPHRAFIQACIHSSTHLCRRFRKKGRHSREIWVPGRWALLISQQRSAVCPHLKFGPRGAASISAFGPLGHVHAWRLMILSHWGRAGPWAQICSPRYVRVVYEARSRYLGILTCVHAKHVLLPPSLPLPLPPSLPPPPSLRKQNTQTNRGWLAGRLVQLLLFFLLAWLLSP